MHSSTNHALEEMTCCLLTHDMIPTEESERQDMDLDRLIGLIVRSGHAQRRRTTEARGRRMTEFRGFMDRHVE
jgi:hypothetical protein